MCIIIAVCESVRCQYMVYFNPIMHHSAGYDRFAFNISAFTRGLAHLNFDRTFCKQIVGILIRRCALWSDLDLQCLHVSHKKDVDVASDVGVNLCNVKSCLNTSNNEIFTDKRGDLPCVNSSKLTCPVVKWSDEKFVLVYIYLSF